MSAHGFGKSVQRKEDSRLLQGAGRFIDDINLDGQVYGFVYRSDRAHAQVLDVDLSAARVAPGVLQVLDLDTAEADGLGYFPADDPLKNIDGTRPFTPVRRVLAGERVRYVGEPMFFVVAQTPDQARDAAERIVVTYQDLPAVTTGVAAVAPGAPQIWPEAAGNVSLHWQAGDARTVDDVFAAAAHVTRLSLVNNRIMGWPLEPVGALGDYHRGGDRYTLYAPSQGVHTLRDVLAEHVLHIPQDCLQVITSDVGGGFGVRIFPTQEQALVLWASRRVGRPVKWIAARTEASQSDVHARDHFSKAALALDADGKFLAVRVSTLANLGAYVQRAGRLVPTAGYAAAITGAYAIAHFAVEVKAVFTNTVMTGAFRGAGRPEALYVVERLVDAAAQELGLAPDELRRRNFIGPQAFPYNTGTGEEIDSGAFAKVMQQAQKAADYENFGTRRAAAGKRGRLRGIGISSYIKINGGAGNEMAELRFAPNGALALYIGSQDNGQGHATAYAQLVEEFLGVPFSAVSLVQGDSGRISYGKGTGGSSALAIGGSAVKLAADQIIETAKPWASHMLEVASDDLIFDDGAFQVVGTDRAVTLSEIAQASYKPGTLTDALGFGLSARAHFTASAHTYTNGCHICEVEVDAETGRVNILKYTAVDDLGRVLNPAMAAGQIYGGVAQGIGQALFENSAYDSQSGQFLTASLMDYGLPHAGELPDFDVAFYQEPCRTNALGVKGAGEAGTTGAPPAVVNAVLDALRPKGVKHIDMPLTPEVVWRALQDAKKSQKIA